MIQNSACAEHTNTHNMASSGMFRRMVIRALRSPASQDVTFSKRTFRRSSLVPVVTVAAGSAGIYAFYCWIKGHKQEIIPVLHARDESKEEPAFQGATYRERRFNHFASVQYEGTIYMTPQDFLESVTEEVPRPRIGRTTLTKTEVDSMLRSTPTRYRGSNKLFRTLHDRGIISYTEYLFLLCVLTKPHSGFRIAFNMFDTDGNQIVDKKEFLVLERVFSKQHETSQVKREVDGDQDAGPVQDTTLLVHFFGQKGTDVLNYDDFTRFTENLQSEVIELEFLEFSKGMNTISEVDFAHILLRYTLLDRGEVEECIQRVRERIPQERGISFQEFKKFCQFLNNLDDFTIAMKMYTYAQQPVSQEEFQRAVKVCTGFTLGSHVVNTVFQIFDSDGDGHLSHQEFISIMKDRLHRGARSHLMHTQNSWEAFRSCVKTEMKSV